MKIVRVDGLEVFSFVSGLAYWLCFVDTVWSFPSLGPVEVTGATGLEQHVSANRFKPPMFSWPWGMVPLFRPLWCKTCISCWCDSGICLTISSCFTDYHRVFIGRLAHEWAVLVLRSMGGEWEHLHQGNNLASQISLPPWDLSWSRLFPSP